MIKTLSRYRVGNAQTIGRREVQSNYFATAYDDKGDLFAVLADGTIDHPNARRAAIIAVEYCVDSFLQYSPSVYDKRLLFETALRANQKVQDLIYTDKSPRLSLTMLLFTGRRLRYFNVGSNKVCLYTDTEKFLGNNMETPYSNGEYNLTPKDVIGVLSYGVYSDAHPMERIRIMRSEKKIFDKAQAIVESVAEKSLAGQTNATVLLVEVVK